MRRSALALAALLFAAPPLAAQRVFLAPADARVLVEREGAVVLEAGRTAEAFAEGHLAGAVSIPFADIVRNRNGIPNELPPVEQLERVLEAAGVDDARPVLVYGEPLAAARLWLTLDLLGHPRAHLLDGGVPAWVAAGLPLATGAPAAPTKPGAFTPALRDAGLIETGELAAHYAEPALLLVDARSPGEYAGTQQSAQVPRPGHIPGARSVYWRRLLRSDTLPALRDERELRQLLALPDGAGTLVAYCRTGHMASMLYAVARELALPVRLYDPSFVEWSGRGDLPVEQGPPGSAAR